MFPRHLLSIALMASMVGSLHAAPAPIAKGTAGPPIVFQLAPTKKLLETVKTIVGIAAGDAFAGIIDAQIQGKLGEKGFAGLDQTKPIAGWVYLPDKLLDDPNDFKDVYGFVAIPVTGENEFKDFVLRLAPDNPLKFNPVEGKPGLYALEVEAAEPEMPIRARFHDGHIYIGFNANNDLLDAKALPPVKSFLKLDDPGLLLVRIFTDRYPEAMLKQQEKQFEELGNQFQNLGVTNELIESIFKSYMALSQRLTTQMKDTDETGFRVSFDDKSSDLVFDSYGLPKKGTAYAREIAEMKPTTNRFAALLSDTTVAGVTAQLPIAAPELRDILSKLIEAGQKEKENAPEFARSVIDEALKGMGRTIKGEAIDFAFGVNGSAKDKQFTFFGAMSFEDASGLEKAIKAAHMHKDAPQEFKEMLKLDVDKIEGFNVHRVSIDAENEELRAIFGSLNLHFVAGSKGLYLAMGPDWKDTLKTALNSKPVPAKVFELSTNPKRLGDLIHTGNEAIGETVRGLLGKEDRRMSVLAISYEGGTSLNARVTINLKILPKLVTGWFTTQIAN